MLASVSASIAIQPPLDTLEIRRSDIRSSERWRQRGHEARVRVNHPCVRSTAGLSRPHSYSRPRSYRSSAHLSRDWQGRMFERPRITTASVEGQLTTISRRGLSRSLFIRSHGYVTREHSTSWRILCALGPQRRGTSSQSSAVQVRVRSGHGLVLKSGPRVDAQGIKRAWVYGEGCKTRAKAAWAWRCRPSPRRQELTKREQPS